jgi:hypothetical protein
VSRVAISGDHPPYAILGPVPCQACRVLVWWAKGLTRVDGKVVAGLAFWRERGGRVHRHAGPVQAPGVRPKVPVKATPHRYPQLANARAEWDNRLAGTSSQSNRLSPDAVSLLVPGEAASLRVGGRD